MKLIKHLLILLFLTGITAPSFAAVSDIETPFCSALSDADKKEGNEEEEEEPDCE